MTWGEIRWQALFYRRPAFCLIWSESVKDDHLSGCRSRKRLRKAWKGPLRDENERWEKSIGEERGRDSASLLLRLLFFSLLSLHAQPLLNWAIPIDSAFNYFNEPLECCAPTERVFSAAAVSSHRQTPPHSNSHSSSSSLTFPFSLSFHWMSRRSTRISTGGSEPTSSSSTITNTNKPKTQPRISNGPTRNIKRRGTEHNLDDLLANQDDDDVQVEEEEEDSMIGFELQTDSKNKTASGNRRIGSSSNAGNGKSSIRGNTTTTRGKSGSMRGEFLGFRTRLDGRMGMGR